MQSCGTGVSFAKERYYESGDQYCPEFGVDFSVCSWRCAGCEGRSETDKTVHRRVSRTLQLGVEVWKGLRRPDGYFRTRSMDTIDYEHIKAYDVVVTFNRVESIGYSDKELAAVKKFLSDGGGLLIIARAVPTSNSRVKFRNGRFVDLSPLPYSVLSTNQLTWSLFRVAFSDAYGKDTPLFNRSHPACAGADFSKLSFKQRLSLLICRNPAAVNLVEQYDAPVAVALQYGKGRVIVCAASRLLLEYGTLTDRALGKTDDIIDAQKKLLDNWLQWLSEARHSSNYPGHDYDRDILPSTVLSAAHADFYCIEPMRVRVRRLAGQWERVWDDFSKYLSVESPVQFVRGADSQSRLSIYVRAAKSGGLSGGTKMSIPGFGEEWRNVGVLSHEIAHKLLRGINTSMAEAWAEWMNCRGLRANGFDKEASEKLRSHIADFREVDPTGTKLDITDRLSDIKQSKACQGKWMWILTELQRRYGDAVLGRYTKYYAEDLARREKARPRGRGQTARVTMADVNRYMSKAVGQDLTPWFRSLGITVPDTP